MKKSFIVYLLLSIVVSAFASVAIAQDAAIEAPADSEVVYTNMIELIGYDTTAVENNARWAVRQGTCAAGTNTVAGNVDGYSNDFTWIGGEFYSMFDATNLPGGEYCFILNTQQGAAQGNRLTQVFYIVDEYVKAGGTICMGCLGKGNSPTHSIEGVVGKVGGTVYGSITVNYRELGEYITYDAASLTFRAANGIGVSDPTAVGVTISTGGANIFVLDRDASEDFPRGAIVLRAEGTPFDGPYEIDNTPGQTGADSWVKMDKGNNHTGIRQ